MLFYHSLCQLLLAQEAFAGVSAKLYATLCCVFSVINIA